MNKILKASCICFATLPITALGAGGSVELEGKAQHDIILDMKQEISSMTPAEVNVSALCDSAYYDMKSGDYESAEHDYAIILNSEKFATLTLLDQAHITASHGLCVLNNETYDEGKWKQGAEELIKSAAVYGNVRSLLFYLQPKQPWIYDSKTDYTQKGNMDRAVQMIIELKTKDPEGTWSLTD